MVWHYRRADAELSAMRARELVSHLKIKNAGINKGTAAARWLTEYAPDFILAIGDDRTDEDTFGAMPSEAYTIKVGSAPRSLARFHVRGTKEVRQLLRQLWVVGGSCVKGRGLDGGCGMEYSNASSIKPSTLFHLHHTKS